MKYPAILILSLALLSGCDRLSERMGMPDPAKVLAEGKAVGGACRHAGRGLEDCYKLNPRADKAAVYEGWKEMNEYMAKNNMQAVPPSLGDEAAGHAGKRPAETEAAAAHAEPAAAEGKADAPKKDGAKPAKDAH
ncbi:MAG TPA: hypothetical protein PLW81_00045 [Thiobacillaceae bacterium]|nr:hypothetical protein [Thiobacillaceae bacterium]